MAETMTKAKKGIYRELTMQHCILVLGMHRSGTSALSGMLNILNVYQGRDLLPASNANIKGFFENKHILDFNEKVLYEHGSSSDDIFFSDKNLIADKYSEELKSLITEKFGHARCFSIKDPRICLLFPIYEKALTEMGITIHPIIIYRNPIETAVSLQKRDGFSIEKGLILWLEHFLLSEKYTRPHSRLFVQFDQLLQNPFPFISTLQDTWQLNLEINPDIQKRLRLFLQSDLKHVNIPLHNLSQKLPVSMQKLIRILAVPQEINNYQDTLDEIRQAYFREKAFFFLKELHDGVKKTEPLRFAQFFIDTGQGFRENESQRILNPEYPKSLELDLTQFSDIQGIRFDPLNQAIAISILSVEFQLDNNEWLPMEAHPLNACYLSDEMDYFSHGDPNYFIPVPRTLTAQLRRLVIHVNYHKIGGREVAPIVCTMLRQRLHMQRKTLIHHIVKREQWWKKRYETENHQLQSKLLETEIERKKVVQTLDVERRAKVETEQELSELKQILDREHIRTNQLMTENLNIKQELQHLYNSRTWRMTKPLRRLITWLKKKYHRERKITKALKTLFQKIKLQIFSHLLKFYFLRKKINRAPNPIKIFDSKSNLIDVFCNSEGNYFFFEITLLIIAGLKDMGFEVSIKNENDMFRDNVDLNIIIAPHEFFYCNKKGQSHIDKINSMNTIMLNTEQLHTEWFSKAEACLDKAFCIWDMDYHSYLKQKEYKTNIYYLPIGFSEKFKYNHEIKELPVNYNTCMLDKTVLNFAYKRHSLSDRPIDVLFMGNFTERRCQILSKLAPILSKYNCYLHDGGGSEAPLISGITTHMNSEVAIGLAQRSKILLNIHQNDKMYFEWHRIVNHGIWNKALVITEPVSPSPFFVSNTHFIETEIDSLGETIDYYLSTPQGSEKADEIVTTAYKKLTEDCRISASLIDLLEQVNYVKK